VLEGDIQSCFDRISHEWMLTNIPTDTEVLAKWLRAGYVENRTLFPTTEGTPQGGIVSPVVANMTLDGLEKLLQERFPMQWDRTEKKQVNPKVHLIRYADDFIVTGNSKELLDREGRPLIERFLAERGLRLSPEKTTVTHIDTGFDFLGQNLRKYRGHLLIRPSDKNVKAFLEKVRGIIKASRSETQETLIGKLNPVIRGWANYHRHIVATRTFRSVDHAIWCSLWQWALRRHPNKGQRWVAQNYWHTTRLHRWAFAVDTGERSAEGKTIWLRLACATDTGIRRHRKIKKDANPFDPVWAAYFEERERLYTYGSADPNHGRQPVVKTGSASAEL
jgi:RNA-directed DNA polymerase